MNSTITIYNFETLIEDESFRAWVIDNDTKNKLFWENEMANHSESTKIIIFTKSFLLALQEPIAPTPKHGLDLITAKILAR